MRWGIGLTLFGLILFCFVKFWQHFRRYYREIEAEQQDIFS